MCGLAAAFAGDQAFALGAFACKLAGTADGFGLLARFLFRRLFIVAAKLHFAKDAFALHFLFQRFERLINIVVPNQYCRCRLAGALLRVVPVEGGKSLGLLAVVRRMRPLRAR